MTNFQNWLTEKKTIILFSLAFTLIFIIIGLIIWGKRLNDLKKKLQEKSWHWQKKINELNFREEKNKIYTENLKKEEGRLIKLNESLTEKEKIITKQIENNFQKEKEWQEKNQFLIQKQQEVEEKVEEISQMEKEEAKQFLFNQVKKEIKDNLEKYTKEEVRKSKERVEKEVTNLICLSLERYSTELIFTKTVNSLIIEDRKILSKIIGRDGKNINFFRKITGADIIIDKENQKDKKTIVEISSFNSLRREIATRTLKRLIDEQKITPLYIEKTFQEINKEVEIIIQQSGEEVCQELEITFLHPELVKNLGKLKFRTSYGQNVLEHCLEVAKLAGIIAGELGLDVELAKKAGLLHDIGKAFDDDTGASHVTNGIVLAKQYGESEIVINTIASHHRDVSADNFYSLIVMAADTLSAARPGARGQQLETYLARMDSLENLSKEVEGVEKIYAFQAGREIRVFVDAHKVNDYQMFKISQAIRKKIQEQIVIPGDVTISVLRETKITEKLTNIGRPSQNVIISKEKGKQQKRKLKRDKKAPRH